MKGRVARAGDRGAGLLGLPAPPHWACHAIAPVPRPSRPWIAWPSCCRGGAPACGRTRCRPAGRAGSRCFRGRTGPAIAASRDRSFSGTNKARAVAGDCGRQFACFAEMRPLGSHGIGLVRHFAASDVEARSAHAGCTLATCWETRQFKCPFLTYAPPVGHPCCRVPPRRLGRSGGHPVQVRLPKAASERLDGPDGQTANSRGCDRGVPHHARLHELRGEHNARHH